MTMTIKEFQNKYYEYETDNQMDALRDALKLKVLDESGKEVKIVPVQINNKWCLMLETAYSFLKGSKILKD